MLCSIFLTSISLHSTRKHCAATSSRRDVACIRLHASLARSCTWLVETVLRLQQSSPWRSIRPDARHELDHQEKYETFVEWTNAKLKRDFENTDCSRFGMQVSLLETTRENKLELVYEDPIHPIILYVFKSKSRSTRDGVRCTTEGTYKRS